MKPHPQIRKTIKWGGAAVTVLLVVVWAWSGWRGVGWDWSRVGIGIRAGRFLVTYTGYPRDITGFSSAESQLFHWDWWFESSSISGLACLYWFPIWAAVLAALLATVCASRLDTLARRRKQPHLCPKCGYDRTGIAKDAKCPECGSGGTAA